MVTRIKILVANIWFYIASHIYWLIFKMFIRKPTVMSPEETIKKVIDCELSVARYGEGEFKIMCKKGKIGFQDLNEKLSEKLLESFKQRNNNLLVCSYNFSLKRPMNVESGRWLRNYVYIYYRYLIFFDKSYIYGDTDISRFYQPDCYKYTNYDYLEKEYLPLLKGIWENKKLLIVEGEETRLGVGNDLFSKAKGIRRILCPARNAFDKYEKIIQSVLKIREKDELVILALGPTASVLATELCCKYNVRAIDLGHVDVVYLWFKNKVHKKVKIDGKYVNEASDENDRIAVDEEDVFTYEKQIIVRV